VALKILISGLLSAILCLSLAAVVAAKSPSASTKLTHPVESSGHSLPSTTGPVVTDSAITQAYNTWSAQITPTLAFTGGVFSPDWQRRGVGSNLPTRQQQISVAGNYKSLQVPVQLYYGLTSRLDASVTVPFMQNWASAVGPASQAANFGSLGDCTLTLRYMVVDGSFTATKVTGYFSVLVPAGHARQLESKLLDIDQTGIGAFAFTWGLDIFKYLPQVPILLYGNLWYTNYADGKVNGAKVYYSDQVTANFALEIPFQNSPKNCWAFLLEFLSTWDAGRMIGPQGNQASSATISVAGPGVFACLLALHSRWRAGVSIRQKFTL
jgi:hypothetical protein